MNIQASHQISAELRSRWLTLLLLLLVVTQTTALAQTAAAVVPSPTPNKRTTAVAGTPSSVVREFYRAMRERRYRDAFAMSIYRAAVEPLTPEEFEELRPDFEKIAAAIPEKVEISGEQISAETATVFVKTISGDDTAAPETVTLLRAGATWIVGDRDNQQIVAKSGKKFFFDARIEAHHSDVREMMQRIAAAELVYSTQHGGQFGDLRELVHAGLVPQDLLATASTGYQFHVASAAGGKSFQAGAEPARYGQTGRLSFYLDASGLKSDDKGGKPLKASPTKK